VDAAYVFRVRFRLRPAAEAVTVSPAEFETVLEHRAPPPGTEGWLFFRDHLWRGEAGDERHLRDLATEWLGAPVAAVSFAELRTDRAYLDALREAVAADPDAFDDDDPVAVLHKYLGSSIHVREDGDG
jgi:hypothetical protein